MARALIVILLLTSPLALPWTGPAGAAASSGNPLHVAVDSLRTSAGAGRTVATTTLRASGAVVLPQLVAAVRDAAGRNVDFPLLRDVSLGPAPRTFTFSRAFGPGPLTVWIAYRSGSRWFDLRPVRTFRSTARMSGVYAGWPQTAGRLDAFGAWRGRAVGVAADTLDRWSWTDIEGPRWWTGRYRSTAYASRLLIAVPMLPDDPSTTLARGAAGDYDAHFARLAHNLVAAGLGSAIIRLGWEFNSPMNYRWSAVARPAEFAEYFRHVVTAMRAVNRRFAFDLCVTVAVDGDRLDLPAAWPGDAYVDDIGMDLYDMSPGGRLNPAERWHWYLAARGGLDDLSSFAAAHRKPMSFDEWALASPGWGGGGDDPYFIQAMFDWMNAHPIAFETYNNVRYRFTNGRLDDESYPRAAAKYRDLFGG
jgi:hypothetical protein